MAKAAKKNDATPSKSTTKSAKKSTAKKSAPTKDPKGGLTAAGRAKFKKTEGANLKPGVQGKADTPEKMKRKGSFLRRHFANLRGPLVDDSGKPTRLALQAHAWGEPVPKTAAAAKKLADKGAKLLEQYHEATSKNSSKKTAKKSAKKSAAKSSKPTAKKATAKKSAAKGKTAKKAAK